MTESDAYEMFHAMLLVAIGLRAGDTGKLFAGSVAQALKQKHPSVDFDKAYNEALVNVNKRFPRHGKN